MRHEYSYDLKINIMGKGDTFILHGKKFKLTTILEANFKDSTHLFFGPIIEIYIMKMSR